jgi:hypothetical protein
MSRPTGVVIIAVLAALNGIVDIVGAGNAFAKVGLPGFGGFSDTFAVIGLFMLGVVWMLAAYGFWKGEFWARILGLIWATLSLVAAIWMVFAFLPVITTVLVPLVVSAIPPLVVLWYLRRPDIRRWFEAN